MSTERKRRVVQRKPAASAEPSADARQVLEELEGWVRGLTGTVVGAEEALAQVYLLRDRLERAERAARALQAGQAEAAALLMIWG